MSRAPRVWNAEPNKGLCRRAAEMCLGKLKANEHICRFVMDVNITRNSLFPEKNVPRVTHFAGNMKRVFRKLKYLLCQEKILNR